MPVALSYTKIFAGAVQATAVHQAVGVWPLFFEGDTGVYVVYDDRIFYDQAITFDGHLLAADVSLALGITVRRTPKVGDTRRRPPPGDTRRDTAAVGGTRSGRLVDRALPTRVTRYTLLAVQPTRTGVAVGPTKRRAMIGPTRVKRGK